MSSNQPQPQPGEFCWNELMTPDTKKARAFYESLLGWTSQDQDMGNGVTYTMFSCGDKGIGGMLQTPSDKQGIPPHWMGYINVANLDETITKAKSLGAQVMVPASQAGDYGRFAIIQDPTGAHIALWQSLKSC